MKQFIVNRHTTPSTPTLDEVPNEKIRTFKSETALDAALSSLDEDEIVATEDGAESSTRIGNPLGTILAIHSNAVPYGYLPCNGVAFDEHQYPALYALLGDNHTPVEGHTLDWDNAESITLSTSDYVVQKNGWLVGYYQGGGQEKITVNGVVVSASWVSGSGDNPREGIQMPVEKGDIIKSDTTINDQSISLIPYKYYKVIKATSGLEETQQDYVLQSLLEADNYSTDEVATGKKWIDGKTIYRKCYRVTGTTSISNAFTNLDQITAFNGIVYRTDNIVQPLAGTDNPSSYGCWGGYNSQTNTISFIARNISIDHILLTVEYTKAN